jgi:hypothetical protein
MQKKLIAASAVSLLMLFACSSDDSGPSSGPGDSSDSTQTVGDGSSSSTESFSTVLIADLSNKASQLFKTWPYGYTLKEGDNEDLTQFWSCSALKDPDEKPPAATCELDKTNAILQNKLTNQFADLSYVIGNFPKGDGSFYRAIKLDSYKLTAAGDQAALGLNVYEGGDADAKNIGELGASVASISGATGFSYGYAGGTHEFRAVSKNNEDFWYVKVNGSASLTEITISAEDFRGMGSYADDADDTPFDLSKVAKFLWVVEFDEEVAANNSGSLLVHSFNAKIKN